MMGPPPPPDEDEDEDEDEEVPGPDRRRSLAPGAASGERPGRGEVSISRRVGWRPLRAGSWGWGWGWG